MALATKVLGFWAVLNLFRGLLHAYHPMSGATMAVGIDPNMAGIEYVVFLLAVFGARQVTIGLFQLLIIFKAPQLVHYAYGFTFIQVLIGLTNGKQIDAFSPGRRLHYIEMIVAILMLLLHFFQNRKRKPE